MHVKDCLSKQCILGTIGTILVVFGGIFAIFWMDLFGSILEKEMKLAPNSKSYELWKDPPVQMSLDIYLFNWTNPTNFTHDEFEKPILQELGPYRFTEITDKTQIKWHPENSTVSFRRKSDFYFDAEGSKGSLDDVVIAVNMVALSASAKAINWSFVKQKSVSVGLSMYHQKNHIIKTARELIFEGYQDDLIDIAREVPFFDDEKLTIPFDRFGWFYMRNGTDNQTGYFNMHTGEGDISQIGVVKNWNYQPRTDFFPDACGQINGSAGEFYPPNQQKDTPISFYSPDLCRTVSLDFSEEQTIYDITGFKYSAGETLLDNGTLYPPNKCFSTSNHSIPSGVIDVSTCRLGAPVFMSMPHFYGADSYFTNQVEGLNPSKEKHQLYITLEPTTGIPLDVAARFQINLLIRSVPNVAMYQEAPYIFFPAIWFEQKVMIPPDMAAEIRMVLSVPTTGYICIGIIILIGVIMLMWLPITRKIQKKKVTKSDSAHMEKGERLAPDGSPLLNKNGNVKSIEMVKMKPKDEDKSQQKLAPLAEKET